MKIFFSFSGPRGKAVADMLGAWLGQIIQTAEPWISSDIQKGARWLEELETQLREATFGIICVTSDSLTSPWILFEAGALSKTSGARVCTFLLDVAPEDVEFPLAQFQHTVPTKLDIHRLLDTINRVAGDAGERLLADRVLDDLFETLWPKLETMLSEIPPAEEVDTQPLDHASHDFVVGHALVLFQAEDLLGKLSTVTDDKDASSGRCRYAMIRAIRDHIVFGPYKELPGPGNYVAFYRIKIARDMPIGPLLFLDVSGGGYASRQLYRASFTEPQSYDVFALPFRVETQGEMEYRVLPNSRGKFWVDYIAVARADEVTQ